MIAGAGAGAKCGVRRGTKIGRAGSRGSADRWREMELGFVLRRPTKAKQKQETRNAIDHSARRSNDCPESLFSVDRNPYVQFSL